MYGVNIFDVQSTKAINQLINMKHMQPPADDDITCHDKLLIWSVLLATPVLEQEVSLFTNQVIMCPFVSEEYE